MSDRTPVAYAVVRVGERFHHHEIFRCEEDADAVARMLIADTGADWRVWPLVYGRKPKAFQSQAVTIPPRIQDAMAKAIREARK